MARRAAESIRLYDELVYILRAFGIRGRSSIYMATPLSVRYPPFFISPTSITKYSHWLLSDSPHSQRVGAYQAANRDLEHPSHAHDDIVEGFFKEYEANWGVSAAELCEVSFRTQWVLPILDAPVPSSPTHSGNAFNNGSYNHPHARDVSLPSSLNSSVTRLPSYNYTRDPRLSDRSGNLREGRTDHGGIPDGE